MYFHLHCCFLSVASYTSYIPMLNCRNLILIDMRLLKFSVDIFDLILILNNFIWGNLLSTSELVTGKVNIKSITIPNINTLSFVHKASKKSIQFATSLKVVNQPAVKKQCQSLLKRAKNRRLKVLYCHADTFTQEKKHTDGRGSTRHSCNDWS